MNNTFNIILLGAPGSGKGTQAKKIAAKYGLDHVSTGDLFRNEISNHTPLGLQAEEIINRGDLCPDDLTIGMLANHIRKHPESKGFILDGVPRTIEQAEMLDNPEIIQDLHLDLVLDIHVDMSEVTKRILKRAEIEKRTDDTPEVVKARVQNFFALTQPLQSYYYDQNKLMKINGMQDVDHVFADICKSIDSKLSK